MLRRCYSFAALLSLDRVDIPHRDYREKEKGVSQEKRKGRRDFWVVSTSKFGMFSKRSDINNSKERGREAGFCHSFPPCTKIGRQKSYE